MAETFELQSRINPFRETIVASPWETPRVDVPGIHGRVYDECLAGIDFIRQTNRSASLLIFGEAGAGKTHLLRRLRAKLAPQAPSSTYRQETLFVWVRLQTSPRMIWRTVRRTLVDDWFRPVSTMRSQFERILFHRLAEKRPAEGDLERWYEYMLDEVPDGLKELINEISTDLDLDRNTAVAFEHIAFRRHLRDLRAWLGGASLPEAALARMDLSQDEGTDEEREDQSRYVVQMLCRLAGNGLPIVLCFDQVEALQMAPGEFDGLFAFGQLASTIHDGTTNVLIVSCMQSSFFNELKEHIRGADYDRMTSLGSLSLDPLNREQAQQLIAARLFGTGDALHAANRPACWPLEATEFETLFSTGSVSPRRLLAHCAEKMEGLQNTPRGGVPGDSITDVWSKLVEQTVAQNNVEQTEEIVRHALPMLIALRHPESRLVRDEKLPDVSLVVESPAGRTGISVCTQTNMTSLAARLRRLKEQWSAQRLQRLVIVRDDRAPLTTTAKSARKYLDELQQQNVAVIHPATEVLATLDALRRLLSDAKSGDLFVGGKTVTPQSVEEWLLAKLPKSLDDLLTETLGGVSPTPESTDTRDIESLGTLLGQQPVVNLHDAASMLGRTFDELAAVVRRHPDHFGLLGEPPEILFRVVDSGEESPEVTAAGH